MYVTRDRHPSTQLCVDTHRWLLSSTPEALRQAHRCTPRVRRRKQAPRHEAGARARSAPLREEADNGSWATNAVVHQNDGRKTIELKRTAGIKNLLKDFFAGCTNYELLPKNNEQVLNIYIFKYIYIYIYKYKYIYIYIYTHIYIYIYIYIKYIYIYIYTYI